MSERRHDPHQGSPTPTAPPTSARTVLDVRPEAAAPCRRLVPGYEIVRELGRGGMGVVYLARQVRLGRLGALQMIRPPRPDGEELRRFRTEAEGVAGLAHPNVVQIHEVGEHAGQPFFSLEYCPGGSLDRRLAGKPMDPAAAASLCRTL